MLDPKFIREHITEMQDTIRRQKRPELLSELDALLRHEAEWRKLKGQADALRAERNKVSEAINAMKKAKQDAAPLIAKAKNIPGEIKAIEERMEALFSKEMLPRMRKMPNIMHKDVPYGEGPEQNVETYRWGEPRKFSFPPLNHVELCERNGWADFEAAAKTTGKGFYFLKGDLALLNQALIRYATELMLKKGYTYIEPPLMVRRPILTAAMDIAAIEQSIYGVTTEEKEAENALCLIGTAEHAILGMHAGQTLPAEELPKRYFGYSMCFRQEIGAHGINEKGLWRTHQFNKVEQFIFCTPEFTWQSYDELMRNSQEVLEGLGLPYRIIELCTGDLAIWKARSHDFEVWRPTTQEYAEVMSLSNCTTYQATDLDIRYAKRNGERGIIHTLNNTALATSRIMVAILENFQERDGSIMIPEPLRPFMGGKKKMG